MPTELTSFLRSYHTLANTGDKAKLERMNMLVELRPMTAVWQVGRYVRWRAFLIAEQLCPVTYYDAFEKATQLFSKQVIERIGADAAVVLTKIEEHLREDTLNRIDTYIGIHKMRPSNRMVYAFVRSLRLTVVVRRKGQTQYVVRH
jgi:hypothetical protein